MTADNSAEVAKIRQLFEQFERAESLEEKADYFEEGMQAAKDALEGCEDDHAQRVIANLKMAYTRKLLVVIANAGEKTTDDLLNLLICTMSAMDTVERVRLENPQLSEKFEEFLRLVRKNDVIMKVLNVAPE